MEPRVLNSRAITVPMCSEPQKDKSKQARKRQTTKISKRKKTLFQKAHSFHEDCGFEVYLLLRKGYRSYVYNSRQEAPPPHAEIVSTEHKAITAPANQTCTR